MPKVQIDLPQNIHDELKAQAKAHCQSLRAYIVSYLTKKLSSPVIAWLDRNSINPYEINEEIYNLLKKSYPDITMNEFITCQHKRQK